MRRLLVGDRKLPLRLHGMLDDAYGGREWFVVSAREAGRDDLLGVEYVSESEEFEFSLFGSTPTGLAAHEISVFASSLELTQARHSRQRMSM